MSGTMKLTITLGLLLATIQVAYGQDYSKKVDVSRQLSLMGFTLGRSTLTDVQNKIGTATAGACSKEEEASKVICYVSQGPDKVRVYFEAGFSGGWSRLDGVKVVSGKLTSSCRLQCTRTAAFARGLQTEGGLRLGLNREELIRLLGTPTKVNQNRLTFEWLSKQPMTETEIDRETETFKAPVTDPYWDVSDSIDITLEESVVAEFEIKHIVTY